MEVSLPIKEPRANRQPFLNYSFHDIPVCCNKYLAMLSRSPLSLFLFSR